MKFGVVETTKLSELLDFFVEVGLSEDMLFADPSFAGKATLRASLDETKLDKLDTEIVHYNFQNNR